MCNFCPLKFDSQTSRCLGFVLLYSSSWNRKASENSGKLRPCTIKKTMTRWRLDNFSSFYQRRFQGSLKFRETSHLSSIARWCYLLLCCPISRPGWRPSRAINCFCRLPRPEVVRRSGSNIIYVKGIFIDALQWRIHICPQTFDHGQMAFTSLSDRNQKIPGNHPHRTTFVVREGFWASLKFRANYRGDGAQGSLLVHLSFAKQGSLVFFVCYFAISRSIQCSYIYLFFISFWSRVPSGINTVSPCCADSQKTREMGEQGKRKRKECVVSFGCENEMDFTNKLQKIGETAAVYSILLESSLNLNPWLSSK